MNRIPLTQTNATMAWSSILAALILSTMSFGKTNVPVFILSGQSNMSGMETSVSDLTADQKTTVNNVKINLNSEGAQDKLGKWQTLGPGFGPSNNNLGPELFFGRTLSDSMPGQKIAIIKSAVSGAPLGQTSGYLPPSSNNGTGGTNYKQLISHIDAAIKSFNTAFDTSQYTPQWAGFVWLQGETDAMNQSLANKYETNLKNLISDLRAKTNTPDLPVILPMIDVQSIWTHNSIVRAVDVNLKKQLQNVDTMDTKGLPTNGVHYKAPGHVTIGKVCATRWFNLHYKIDDKVPVVYSHQEAEILRFNQPQPVSQVHCFSLSGRKIGSFDNGAFRNISGPQSVYILQGNKPGMSGCYFYLTMVKSGK
ncbi:MAG TPA: sialate O-acetylesterase [Chitinispirillaceae bacterium]|nr:sialate O-acetylesterase [Chitinispirillaceae bacterium]